MIAVVHLRPADDDAGFQAQAAEVLRVLAERPGFVTGTLCRATDDESEWLLLTEWESVGAYRRGLGGYQVKLIATPLLARAEDRPSAFEALLAIDANGVETAQASDRAIDADWVARTRPSGDPEAGIANS